MISGPFNYLLFAGPEPAEKLQRVGLAAHNHTQLIDVFVEPWEVILLPDKLECMI